MPKLDIVNANNVVEYNPKKAFFQVKNLGGPKGDKGDRGEPGAGLKITDSVATYQDLPTTLEYIDAGSAYVVRSDGQLYIWHGYEFPAEGHGAQFEGPQGPQGEQGERGERGPQGIQGPQGEKGATGAQGPAGQDGTDGTDGFSPEATVEQVGAGARITITDKDGTTTADVAGFTVDDALSDSSTNPVQNKVVKGALDGKQATLGAGDISNSLIADGAITQAKIGSDIEVGEVILDYVQAEDSSIADKAVIALDWSKYRKIVIDVNYSSSDSSTRWDEIVFYEADGNTSTYVRRTGVQMDNSTTVSGYRQNSNAGSVASTHAYGAGEGHLRATITTLPVSGQTASFADTDATYQAALGKYYWNRLGGYYVDVAIAKVDRRSWLAGSYLKVIGYR